MSSGLFELSGVSCFYLKNFFYYFLYMGLSAASSVFMYLRLYVFHFNFRKRTLLDTEFFSFFYFEYFDCLVPLPLYTSIISDEKSAVILLGFPNKRIVVSLDTFKIFSPSLAFSILTVCLGVYLLVFILLGFH